MKTGLGSHGSSSSTAKTMDTYDLVYRFHPKTGKSICVTKSDEPDAVKIFLPLSQIEILTAPEDLIEHKPCKINIPEWLAEEKDLA